MGLIERLLGRRRRESVDSWARRDDFSQYPWDGGDSGDGGDGGGGGNGGGD